jgi:hypothetical protein
MHPRTTRGRKLASNDCRDDVPRLLHTPRPALAADGARLAAGRAAKDPAGPAELRVHPGRHWSTVLSGAVVPRLGERTILVQAGETAQFSTMAPQASGAHDRAAEILCILGHDGSAQFGPAHATAPARSGRTEFTERLLPSTG